jgi:PAS domain S-box-containing protein
MSQIGRGMGSHSNELDREQSARADAFVRMLSALGIGVLCVASLWGHWGRVTLMAIAVTVLWPLNLLFVHWDTRGGPLRTIEVLKNATNFVGTAVAGHLCGWPLPLWLFLPLNAVWFDGLGRWSARWSLAGLVSAVSAVALYDGVSPVTVVSFALLTVIMFAISEARARLLSNHFEELASASRDLEEGQAVAHLGSWSFDVVQNRVKWSMELYRIFGVDPKTFGATLESYIQCVHPDDRAQVLAVSERALSAHQPFAYEHRVARPDGEVRWVYSSGRVRTDGAGRPIRVSGAAHDITERKQLQAQLVLADRLASLGTLAGGVGHEINNPLTYVMTNLDYLSSELKELAGERDGSRLAELVEVASEARQGAERIHRIVRDLRQFARGDEDQGGETDVHEVLDFSIKMASNEIRHRARLVKRYGTLPRVRVNETRLGQVFLNLLVNAAQAVPEGHVDTHEIRILTHTDASGAAVIEVQDTGSGMSVEVQKHIFEPFYTTKPVGAGTGLGLSICHGIVAAFGGEISVHSDPGRGSTFRVIIPAAAVLPAATAIAEAASSPGRRARVLIVDDEVPVASALRRVLSRDHDAETVHSGAEAIERLRNRPPFDLVLCDLLMPEMSGMDVYEALRASGSPHLDRIVFLTGGAFTTGARAALDQLPNLAIDKPFDPANLRKLINDRIR